MPAVPLDSGSSPTHRVLEIPELLDMILQDLEKPALVSLAQTCRLLHVPAISYIWRSLGGYGVLELVDMVLEPYENAEEPIPIALRWERFHLHASFVRRITIDYPNSPAALPEKLIEIAALRPPVHLLPRLEYLSHESNQSLELRATMIFLSPSITEIKIKCVVEDAADWDIPVGLLLYRLQTDTPALKSCTLVGFALVEGIYEVALQNLITSLPSLERFRGDIIALNPSILGVLAQCNSLCDLGFVEKARSVSDLDIPAISTCVGPSSFPALRTLFFEADIEAVTALLLSIRQNTIEELRVEYNSEETLDQAEIGRFASAVHLAGKRLTTLELSFSEADEIDASFSWAYLEGVLKCSAITHFRLQYKDSWGFSLCDHDLEAIALAWPSLRSLSLTWDPKWHGGGPTGLDDENALTIAGLCPLAVHCPQLTTIQLTYINATLHVNVPSAMPQVRDLTHIVSLNVGHSDVQNSEMIALFLFLLWPKLRIVWCCDREDKNREKWGAVVRMLHVMSFHNILRDNSQLLKEFTAPPTRLATAMNHVLQSQDML